MDNLQELVDAILDVKSENILKDKLEVIKANMRKEMELPMEEQRKEILDAE
jgi:septum formation topological specificity factor MinE